MANELLWLAGAIGVGYLIAKKRAETAKTSTAAAAVTAPMRAVTAIPEEDAELFGPLIIESYPSFYGAPYPWYGGYGGGWGGRGGRRHHHHHGGGHGGGHRGGGRRR